MLLFLLKIHDRMSIININPEKKWVWSYLLHVGVSESARLCPYTLYGASNMAAERYLNLFSASLFFSPPVCRAEGDLNDGGHKFSPNSDSPLEPHKTCGEPFSCPCIAPNTHTYCTDANFGRATPWPTPDHNGDSSLSGSEDQSCWIRSPSAANPINLQEGPALLLIFTPSSVLCPSLLILYGLISLCFPFFRRLLWDLRSSMWLQWNWLQRRSTVGEDAVQSVVVLSIYSSCLLYNWM